MKKRRTWHYLYEPKIYEVHCNRGGKINQDHKTAWSEFAGKIWCFDCKRDMRGFGGIFDGPIPSEVTKLIIGPLCFHRYNMKKKIIQAPVQSRDGRKILYRVDKALTAKLVEKA